MSLAANAGRTESRKTRAWRSAMLCVRPAMRINCSRGDNPSADRTDRPVSSRRFRPATRTMKNSSRLEAKMARNFARSSSGSEVSSARARTRELKSSQLNSRFRYRSSGRSADSSGTRVAAGGALGIGVVVTVAVVDEVSSAGLTRQSWPKLTARGMGRRPEPRRRRLDVRICMVRQAESRTLRYVAEQPSQTTQSVGGVGAETE